MKKTTKGKGPQNPDSKLVTLRIDAKLLARVDRFRHKMEYASRRETIEVLLDTGLLTIAANTPKGGAAK